MSQNEPCGIRGCVLFINMQEKSVCRKIGRIECDPSTVATFELYLTLREDTRPWVIAKSVLASVRGRMNGSSNSTKVVCPGYQLAKRKLYRPNWRVSLQFFLVAPSQELLWWRPGTYISSLVLLRQYLNGLPPWGKDLAGTQRSRVMSKDSISIGEPFKDSGDCDLSWVPYNGQFINDTEAIFGHYLLFTMHCFYLWPSQNCICLYRLYCCLWMRDMNVVNNSAWTISLLFCGKKSLFSYLFSIKSVNVCTKSIKSSVIEIRIVSIVCTLVYFSTSNNAHSFWKGYNEFVRGFCMIYQFSTMLTTFGFKGGILFFYMSFRFSNKFVSHPDLSFTCDIQQRIYHQNLNTVSIALVL